MRSHAQHRPARWGGQRERRELGVTPGPTTQQDTAKRGRKRGVPKKKRGEERENEEREKEREEQQSRHQPTHTHKAGGGGAEKKKYKRGCHSCPRTRGLNPTQTGAETNPASGHCHPSRTLRGQRGGAHRVRKKPLVPPTRGPPLPKNGQERKTLLGPGGKNKKKKTSLLGYWDVAL